MHDSTAGAAEAALPLLTALFRSTPAAARRVTARLRADDFDDYRARVVFTALIAVLADAPEAGGAGRLDLLVHDRLLAGGHLARDVDPGGKIHAYLVAVATAEGDAWHAPHLATMLLHQTYRRRVRAFGEAVAEQAAGASLEELARTLNRGAAGLDALRSRIAAGGIGTGAAA